MASSQCSDVLNEEVEAPFHGLRQWKADVEATVLIFLGALTTTKFPAHASTQYKSSQVLAIAQAFFILDVVCSSDDAHEGPLPIVVCTERDLYYRNPPLFGSQRSTHASIERLCRWLDVGRAWSTLRRHRVDMNAAMVQQVFCKPRYVCAKLLSLLKSIDKEATAAAAPLAYTRESLGITAAGKSTLAGALVMELRCPPERVDVSACGAAGLSLTYSLVTRLVRCHRPSMSLPLASTSALVLIEKESTYHAVLQSAERSKDCWSRGFSFLCTKGYPCVAAQQWLRRVHSVWPSLELHVLVDGDPHGLCIALTAMGLFGSCARHAMEGPVAKILPFHFVGVCPSRVFVSGATNDARSSACVSHSALPASEGVSLTRDDRQVLRRIKATLQRALDAETASFTGVADAVRRTVRCALQKMAHEAAWMERASLKCELQLACKPYGSPFHFIEANIWRESLQD
ncbi:hypothetical protein ABL78_2339 [Leptomonas seymouri]|uniref:DNA topoisomerase (ATP-hydrolyzing) n=1 Tax=Leptomonas seymouri TaxID=5684 RepID=A0A0N0P7M4_LEPSE|nr:hypothetical protein ABL78_2339 [Leptomonas seymouri]|eukprot:KPI88527.1 hypothetical protein ABL78_2339 [Leptomonas seymouri]